MSGNISSYEARYFDKFPDIDQSKVGELINVGAQHVVRGYGEEEVIKTPRLHTMRDFFSQTISRILTPTTDRLRRDLDLSMEYFNKHVVPTTIFLDSQRENYSTVQKKLPNIRSLTPAHIKDDAKKEELLEIADGNRLLYEREKMYLDMMGWKPWNLVTLQPALENVVVTTSTDTEKQLLLPDVTLFETDSSLLGIYFEVLLALQKLNMKGFGMQFV